MTIGYFYVWQMNDGRWQVSGFDSAPMVARLAANSVPGFDHKAEAVAAARGLADRFPVPPRRVRRRG